MSAARRARRSRASSPSFSSGWPMAERSLGSWCHSALYPHTGWPPNSFLRLVAHVPDLTARATLLWLAVRGVLSTTSTPIRRCTNT